VAEEGILAREVVFLKILQGKIFKKQLLAPLDSFSAAKPTFQL
jgi:hypothetical protein